jgi:hypothetical protein
VRLALVLQVLVAGIVCAAEVKHISVEYRDGIYFVEFDALVAAEQSKIYTLLTDYDHLDRLNSTITESRIISSESDPVKKCRILLHSCILFFCRDAVMVENIQENGRDEVTASVDPEMSDFSSGQSTWKIFHAGGGMTGIELRRYLEPSFWVPPVIGPWAIKNRMLQELSMLLTRLEQYAST